MGIYLNPNNSSFLEALNSEIYVDKSMIIEKLNKVVCTKQKYVCVSRPRRFGKSMTAEMIGAYYGKGDSRKLFENLKIAESDSFEKYLNKFNVIHLNMQNYLTEVKSVSKLIDFLQEDLVYELTNEYKDVEYPPRKTLQRVLTTIFDSTNTSFVFVIDEWDCIFRVHEKDKKAQRDYLDFLRALLKDQPYIALVYMTGILPIKKYGQHSALNMFTEVSMTDPREYAEFTGFTDTEVKELCEKYNMPFEDAKKWYNGYNLMGIPIYNPRSVVMSMTGRIF